MAQLKICSVIIMVLLLVKTFKKFSFARWRWWRGVRGGGGTARTELTSIKFSTELNYGCNWVVLKMFLFRWKWKFIRVGREWNEQDINCGTILNFFSSNQPCSNHSVLMQTTRFTLLLNAANLHEFTLKPDNQCSKEN